VVGIVQSFYDHDHDDGIVHRHKKYYRCLLFWCNKDVTSMPIPTSNLTTMRRPSMIRNRSDSWGISPMLHYPHYLQSTKRFQHLN
jgi:hypothetical protein